MAGKPAKTLRDKVKLSQLRTLIAVATAGSFSEAALQLDVSQSTVSHSIAALEDALGVMLIHRGRQRASLTPVGDRIYHQAQQALALIDDMGKEATRARGIEGGLVRIAAFRSLASEVLPGAISLLHQQHPTVQVTITEFDSHHGLSNALHEGQADLSMASLLPGDEFETFAMMEDPFIALLPPTYQQLASSYGPNIAPDGKITLTWEDLRRYPLITSSSDCCVALYEHFKQVQPPIEFAYLISNDSTAVSMTRQGLGITLLPKLATQPVPKEVRVASLPFNMTRPLGISWLKNTLLTPAAYAFLDSVKHLELKHQKTEQRRGRSQYGDMSQYGSETVNGESTPKAHEKTALSTTRHD